MGTIKLRVLVRANIVYSRRFKLWDINSRIITDQGFHKLQIGYMLTFKVLTKESFRVIVFYISIIEVVVK